MTKKNNIRAICLLMILALLPIGCEKQLGPAEIIVIDPVRHYYPVVQGENLGIQYEFENISDTPLFIQEVQTTCGCLVSRDQLPIVILPHKRGYLRLLFNSIKNNGYVEHFIYCYGNFKDTTMIELRFDTNVVPKTANYQDYEQLWKHQQIDLGTIKEIVDGSPSEKGYYTEESFGPREEEEEDIQE